MNKSTWKIIAKNTFTLFNLVNAILAFMVFWAGSPKNALFLGVAIANTLISIANELRAKKIVDKLRLLSEKDPVILKNGQPTAVKAEAVKKGDLLVLTLGDQVMYDSVITEGEIEVNEAFISGEQDNIAKSQGAQLTSGSFVVSGTATAKVMNVGADNFVNKLQREASNIKTADSRLFRLMNDIVKYISYTLIPIGALLLWARFRTEADTASAVTSTVAALINMIPEGLILLTSSVLALATIRLSRQKILVNDLYAIETLARVDTICLDKTGTLTTGKMTVQDILTPTGTPINLKNPTTPAEKRALSAIAAILSTSTTENATSTALKKKLAKMPKFEATSEIGDITEVIPFSSARKYSGIVTKNATYLMGAIDFMTKDKEIISSIKEHEANYRTLAVIKTQRVTGVEGFPRSSQARSAERTSWEGEHPAGPVENLLAIIRLKDEIRPTAPKIIDYFYRNGIDVKVISGDDLASVKSIAEAVGVKNLTGINLSSIKTKDYNKLAQEYNIFTRVTPDEKKELIHALKSAGRTVAMTGDGVNDILAMKEADVSLAIGEGSDAARRAAKFVLLNSGFEAVPAIIDEGRQSINNLERSTTLFLAKTVYASILAVVFVFLPTSYPFIPIEMTLLNFLCIGLPGVILALEKNTARPKNLFLRNITHYSVPIGIVVALAGITISVIANTIRLSAAELHSLSFVVTFMVNLLLIYLISRPLNRLRSALIFAVVALALATFFLPFARQFFEFTLPF